MTRTLALLVTAAASYAALADNSPSGKARTYVPARISASEVKSGSRSSEECPITPEYVTINKKQFELYRNEFPHGDELGFMLVVPNDASEIYSFGSDPSETTAINVPQTFYIPTRVNLQNDAGEMVPVREFDLEEKVQAGIPFTLETFAYNGVEFFRPKAKKDEHGKQPFYFIGILPNQENVKRDLTTGTVTIFAENGNGIFEAGEGVYRPVAVSYSEIVGRKEAAELAEVQRLQVQQNALKAQEAAAKAQRQAEEQKKLEELNAPRSGTEGGMRG